MSSSTQKDMSEESVSIRKSAFGRTNLFLTTTGGIFREVKCSSSISRHANVSIFHMHNSCKLNSDPSECCWHCCHGFESEPIRLPRLYDSFEHVYHVYGWFCSPACAKAYIIEHTTFDRGHQMNVFAQMLQEVYGITSVVQEAPPRISLKMFGGPFDIASFRKQTNVCSIVAPPFVSYCMLVEERQPIAAMGEGQSALAQRNTVRGLRRPDKPKSVMEEDMCTPQEKGIYKDFLESSKDMDVDEVEVKPKKKEVSGGLARFAK